MPTILTNGIQLPDKGSVDWYSSMQSNYNLIDTHLGDTDIHVTTEDKANWDGKANASHTHTSSELTDIGDFATKQYVDNSISGLVDNAPDALNTLNELSAALNDDSNFASTVTATLGAKANSADLATVATSGSYTDLTDKPTINDSTITIQKNGSTVDTFTTNGSAKTIDIPVPTKTSDLTNDSNFVDTSNSAVSSGITSAKVTDYDAHIANTEIHVTSADKQKWNNGISQAYVTRYTNTAVSDNSTVAYSDLNNTDNIKIGDFILDVNGKLFEITAVDTANETVSVTTPLTQLAVNSLVVHNSGNEDVNGTKTFKDMIPIDGDYLGNEANTNQRTNICLRSNGDTADKSCAYITRFRQNRSQGALQTNDFQMIGFDVLENEVRTNNVLSIQCTNWLNNVPQMVNIVSGASSYSYGNSARKALFNDINPGALSLPDLNNGIDISGYITIEANAVKESLYTPPANGWVCVSLTRDSGQFGILLIQGNMANGCTRISGVNTANAMLPVVGGVQVSIKSALADGMVYAYFYPCQGNV